MRLVMEDRLGMVSHENAVRVGWEGENYSARAIQKRII